MHWPDGAVSRATDVPLRRHIDVSHPDRFLEPGDDDDAGGGPTTVRGRVLSLSDQNPVAGATVEALGYAPPLAASTDESGAYELLLPNDGPADLLAEASGLARQMLAIDPATQRDPAAGVAHLMLPAEDLELLYTEHLGVARDPAAATVWVRVTSGNDALPGTQVALSVAHAGALVLDGAGGPSPGSTLEGPASLVAFGNVTPGAVEVQVTPPGGETCFGRARLTAEPRAMILAPFDCR